ncbi:MAG: hypothetical protein PHE83_17535 [Opitutaceae bacterium]|nr:hypothetical protein [Opitutaceae bacterium]
MRFCKWSIAAFSLIEVLVTMAVIAAATATVVVVFPGILSRTRSAALSQVAATLNQSSSAFVGSGGQFDPQGGADQALLLLQTPVDEKSQQAGFGVFPLVDPRWTLQTKTSEGERLICVFDAAQKRPVWSVQDSGAGFDVLVDRSKSTPAVADWSAQVDAAGHVTARASAWVWDYHDAAATGSGSAAPATSPYAAPTAAAGLTITGPDTITTAGIYYWTGASPQPGSLTMAVGASQNQADGITQLQSPSQTIHAGDHTTLAVTLTRGDGATITKNVTINVPPSLNLVIAGPDTIADTTPASWTAMADAAASAISIAVQGYANKTALNQASVTSDPLSWPAGSDVLVTLLATATNAAGTVSATKTVTVKLAKEVAVAIEITPVLNASTINARGDYTFTLISKSGTPAHMDLTATASDGRTVSASLDNVTQMPVNLAFNPAETDRLDGTVTINGTVTTADGSKSVSQTAVVAIPRMKQPCQWTIATADGTPATFTMVVSAGGAPIYQWTSTAAAASFTTPMTNLGAGTYTISGSGVVDGKSFSADPIIFQLSP